MSARSLFDPVIDPGIRQPNFFEGRLLTAADMRDEQNAQRQREQLIARAIGAGVAEGLWIDVGAPDAGGVRKTITIRNGYALNAEGELLHLQTDLTAEVIPPTVVPEAPAGLFARCEDAEQPEPQIPIGVGLYLVVMSPASAFRERAPKSGLGSEGRIIGCGDRYAVQGVRFRLEPLAPAHLASLSTGARTELTNLLLQTGNLQQRSVLRNLIAHACFGTVSRAMFAVDPFRRTDSTSSLLKYGALDDLRTLGRLTDCDVPLALMLWNTSGIAFMDVWAVRRRTVAAPRSLDWPTLVQERVAAEGDARLEQFQAHLAELIATVPTPTLISANGYFRYLPPAGLLPLQGEGRPRGVTVPAFMAGRTYYGPFGPVFMEGARLEAVLYEARSYASFVLSEAEMMWTYLLRQNRQPVPPDTNPPAAAYALFTSGHLPFHGEARFDVNRWNYSNYGSVTIR